MSGSIFNAEQRSAWDCDGCVMVRKLFDDEEIAILRTVRRMRAHDELIESFGADCARES